jgi:hypothetical protein
MANGRHRAIERHGQNAIRDAITAANVAVQASRQASRITTKAAQTWVDRLNQYVEHIKTLMIKDFKEGLDKEKKDDNKDEL